MSVKVKQRCPFSSRQVAEAVRKNLIREGEGEPSAAVNWYSVWEVSFLFLEEKAEENVQQKKADLDSCEANVAEKKNAYDTSVEQWKAL